MFGLLLALTLTASPETAEVELIAERVLHDGKREISTAEGSASLVTDGAAVNADRIVYDRDRNVATAMGHVVARIAQGGRIAIVADLLTLRFDDEHQIREVYLYDGQAVSKKAVSAEVLLGASTAEAVEKVGTTQAILQGNHLVRDGNRWTVDELDLVPCECDFKNPSWSITSSSATVDTVDERVSITGAVIRIKNQPVLWLPWLSLPLTERQSGLLFPRPGFGPQNGFVIDQPVFITLGRSADITLSPGFSTGSTGTGIPAGTVLTPGTLAPGMSSLGVAGPKLSTEFRYVPSKRATGKAVLGVLYDFRDQRDVEIPSVRSKTGARRGLRGEFSWKHTQDFDPNLGARVDLNAHSDGDYNRDGTIDVLVSSATYLRSSATVFHRGVDHYVGLDVGLRQDIQWGYDILGRQFDETRTVGKFGPGTLQRLPAVTFGWASQQLGPFRFDVEGDAVRLAPLFSQTGDEGVDAAEGRVLPEAFSIGVARLFSPSPQSNFGISRMGIGDRLWQPGEREARDRLMLMPRLSFSSQPFGVWSISAFGAWRQLGWLGEASGRSWARGYLLLGGRLETEVSRSFNGSTFRHVIQPLAEVRAIPWGLGANGDSFVPYDAVDAAVPEISPRVQGVVELRQRLMHQGSEVLRLDVGQGFEMHGSPTLGESYGRLTASVGWFSLQALLRVDPLNNRVAADGVTPVAAGSITRLAARAEFDDKKGHGVFFSYENLLMEGTARSRQPIDLLFLIDRGFTSATRLQQITLGAQWDFGPANLRYEAQLGERLNEGKNRWELVQHALALGIAPACDCWRVDLRATQLVGKVLTMPMFTFNVSVSRFGSIGTR